jgi:hypothetical protein
VGVRLNITGTPAWYAGGGGGSQQYHLNPLAGNGTGGSGVGGSVGVGLSSGATNTGSGGSAGYSWTNRLASGTNVLYNGSSGAGGSGKPHPILLQFFSSW